MEIWGVCVTLGGRKGCFIHALRSLFVVSMGKPAGDGNGSTTPNGEYH